MVQIPFPIYISWSVSLVLHLFDIYEAECDNMMLYLEKTDKRSLNIEGLNNIPLTNTTHRIFYTKG